MEHVVLWAALVRLITLQTAGPQLGRDLTVCHHPLFEPGVKRLMLQKMRGWKAISKRWEPSCLYILNMVDGLPYKSVKMTCNINASVLMRAAFPKRSEHYSLYSAQHQFTSEIKSRPSKEEATELIGHGKDTTVGKSLREGNPSMEEQL